MTTTEKACKIECLQRDIRLLKETALKSMTVEAEVAIWDAIDELKEMAYGLEEGP